MKEEFWEDIRSFLTSVLMSVRLKLDNESIDAVQHYIKHDEYEMAFEILFIEIMKLRPAPEIDFAKSYVVAKLLDMNKEKVFDDDFWNKFNSYIEETVRDKN